MVIFIRTDFYKSTTKLFTYRYLLLGILIHIRHYHPFIREFKESRTAAGISLTRYTVLPRKILSHQTQRL